MSRTVSVLTVVISLVVQQRSTVKGSCVMWTESGTLVKRGSTLSVFCRFHQRCSNQNITSDHPQQSNGRFNASTIYVKLVNITENTTFNCHCRSSNVECGLDLKAGYPPDRPKNMSCSYIPANTTSRDVACTWDRGRKTYIKNKSALSVEAVSGHRTNKIHQELNGSSAKFSVPSDAEAISVTVQTNNSLGAVAVVWNYTLSDIAKPPPPVLGRPYCSSRACSTEVNQVAGTQYLEVHHRANHRKWKTSVQVNSSKVRVSSLEPNTLYEFRARSKFRSGLWSEWSTSVSSGTQEEAPAEPLNVWWTELNPACLRVYWKEMNSSTARGKILNYIVKVEKLNFIKNISAHERNTSVQFCALCQVAVLACNSRGCSPAAKITHHEKAGPTLEAKVRTHNNSLSLTWPQSNPGITENVVEWYREGHKLEEVQWVRLSRAENQTVIRDVPPTECYEGAVHVFYRGNIRTKAAFRAAILETVPTVGPSVQDNIEGNTVTMTWTEIPRGQRGGCIVKYNVYLENSIGHQRNFQNYSVPASQTNFTVPDLRPGSYSLWMSASTGEGEGPAGRKIKFFISGACARVSELCYTGRTENATQDQRMYFYLIIQADNKLTIGLCGLLFVLGLVLLLLYQCATVRQRLSTIIKYFYEVVPDPANSKWAKEHSQETGKINFQLQLSEASVTEDLPILALVEELPQKTWNLLDISQSVAKSATPHLPLITYINSHSHDSESSGHTESSQDIMVEYIISHQPGYQEEEEEEEEEDEFEDMLGSFSGSFMDSREFGGNLTLDAVKVNCSELFQNRQS